MSSHERRRAIIIGVDALRNHPEASLQGARNSALAWTATLARLGFAATDLTLCADLDALQLAELDRIFPAGRPQLRGDSRYAIRSSTRALGELLGADPALEAILIYCGHSTRRDGQVLMVPSDADLREGASDPRLVGLSLPAIRWHLRSAQSRLLVIFDACEAAEMLPEQGWDDLTVLAATAEKQSEYEVSAFGRPMGAFSAAAALVLGSVKASAGEGEQGYDLTVQQLLDRATATAQSAFGLSLSPSLLNGKPERAVLQRRDRAALATTGETVTGPGWQLAGDTTWVVSDGTNLGTMPAAYPRPDGLAGYWALSTNASGTVNWQKVDLVSRTVGAVASGWADLGLMGRSWLSCWLCDESVNGGVGRYLFVAGQRATGTVVALAQSNNATVDASLQLSDLRGPLAMAPFSRGSSTRANGVLVASSVVDGGGNVQVDVRRIRRVNGALQSTSCGVLTLAKPAEGPFTAVSAPFLIRGNLGPAESGDVMLIVGMVAWPGGGGGSRLYLLKVNLQGAGGSLAPEGNWVCHTVSVLPGTHPTALPIPYEYHQTATSTGEWRYEVAYITANREMVIGYVDNELNLDQSLIPDGMNGLHEIRYDMGRPCLVLGAPQIGLKMVATTQTDSKLLLTF